MMIKQRLLLYIAYICLAWLSLESYQQSFTLIEGYDIDSSGDYDRECEIISGSVTGKRLGHSSNHSAFM